MSRSGYVQPITKKKLYHKQLRERGTRKARSRSFDDEDESLPSNASSRQASSSDLLSMSDSKTRDREEKSDEELFTPVKNSGKNVSFKPVVLCVLIPTAQEYYACGVGNDVWWASEDYRSFKMSAMQDLKELMAIFPTLTDKEVLKTYCKVLNLQLQVHNLSFFPMDDDLNEDVKTEVDGLGSPQCVVHITTGEHPDNDPNSKSKFISVEELDAIMNRIDSVNIHKAHSMEEALTHIEKENLIVKGTSSFSNLLTLEHNNEEMKVNESPVPMTDSLLQFLYEESNQKGLLPTLGGVMLNIFQRFVTKQSNDHNEDDN